MRLRWLIQSAATLLLCAAAAPRASEAYSLQTHEQLIDLTWQSSIVPLLLSRYPTLTPDQIEHARAYAYGGCVIQDIGYYPFGDANFSNLTHYVRSGDFIVNLFRNAGNADELAFAVGALSHYIGDNIGHPTATNLAVPVEFPKLEKRYGKSVNYSQGAHEHVQTEFGFDIHEIAMHRFAPVHYLRHVGLAVPTRQLALAFYQTYGLQEDFTDRKHSRINVSTYRFATRKFIPRIAYAVTVLKRSHEVPDAANDPSVTELAARMAQVSQQNHWDDYRKSAGIGTYSLAGLIWILPKVGPIKMAAVKGPTEATQHDYAHSVMASATALDHVLVRFTPPPATRPSAEIAAAEDSKKDPQSSNAVPELPGASQTVIRGSHDPQHPLANRDLDTGREVKPAAYPLTDMTYAKLLHRLVLHPTTPIPPGIKRDILAYYANLELPYETKRHPGHWDVVLMDLVVLRGMPTSADAVPYPTYGKGDNDDFAGN
ncbi:zinc dependent phospholipase C family protein [Granulicella cerasi]|uniref:Zinc dependent phospholipase C family protein n=1 Tax=Granulicella cerasi TaxID=741063 RepID=A0ABW1Z9Q6_9BACT|nr:zinc dependent phospholipase C family protein [Granulicella cerasi]